MRLLPRRLLAHHAPPPTRLTLMLFEFLLLLYFQSLTRHSSGPTFSSPWSPTCRRRSSHSPHLIDGLPGLVNHWQVSHTGHLIPLPWLVPGPHASTPLTSARASKPISRLCPPLHLLPLSTAAINSE